MSRQPYGYTLHAMTQMLERHGVEPTREEWAAAVADIREGKALLLGRDGSRSTVTFWSVTIAGQAAKVVWRKDTIVTVLPPGQSISKMVEATKAGTVRNSFRQRGRFIRGKRLPTRTQWAPGARQPEHDDDEEAAEA